MHDTTSAEMRKAGHKSIPMTVRYAHLSQSHQQANVEKLTDGNRR